jgi:uncharacterized protein (TIGR00369 family)
MSAMTAPELVEFMHRAFPEVRPEKFRIDSVDDERVVVRYRATKDDLRPGGTVAGPVLMGVADVAMYLAVLSAIGPIALAVTTSLNINFLRKPGTGDLVAETRLLKVGKQLAIGEVYLRTGDDPAVVAHATVTYSIPPDAAATG